MFKYVMTAIFGLVLAASTAHAQEFLLKSKTIKPNSSLSDEQVFNGFGCTGKNISPDLSWTPGPEGTKSYAITAYDPDAPTGSGWWHWVVYNIPAHVSELVMGAGAEGGALLPEEAVQGRTDFGTHGFGGPCPPEGAKPHRYIFTVYALKIGKIDLPEDASPAMIGFMINANSLDKAELIARYGR